MGPGARSPRIRAPPADWPESGPNRAMIIAQKPLLQPPAHGKGSRFHRFRPSFFRIFARKTPNFLHIGASVANWPLIPRPVIFIPFTMFMDERLAPAWTGGQGRISPFRSPRAAGHAFYAGLPGPRAP